MKKHITATPQVTEYQDWTSQLPGPAVLPTYLENTPGSKSFSDQLSNAEERSSEPAEGFPLPSVAKMHCILFSAAAPSVFAALHLWPPGDANRHTIALPSSWPYAVTSADVRVRQIFAHAGDQDETL